MISSTELELLGKKASSDFIRDNDELDSSIKKVAEQHGLNREQVNRVAESANVETYLSLNANAKDDKYIEFTPANSSSIYNNITTFDTTPKIASIPIDYMDEVVSTDFSMHKVAEETDEDISGLQTKVLQKISGVAVQHKNAMYDLNSSFDVENSKLYRIIKQATLQGTPFGMIKKAIEISNPTKFASVLVNAYEDRLKKEAPTLDFSKVAEVPGVLNKDHDIIKSLNKLAQLKEDFIYIRDNYKNLKDNDTLIKTGKASTSKFLSHFLRALGQAAGLTGQAGKQVLTGVAKHPLATVGIPAAGLVGYQTGKKKERNKQSPMNITNRRRK